VAKLLYLVHRMPYPPDKGDKVRSFHLLKQLLANHQVFLGTFVDDEQDLQHIDTLRALCADVHVVRLQPTAARLRSLGALLGDQAMTLRYYANASMSEWVTRTAREQSIDTAVVFSSSMAQYVEHIDGLRMVVDFVDVDSAKWSQYALARPWPLSWLFRREGGRLLAYERQTALRARRSFFVTDNETQLFRGLAPECAGVIEAMGNGVDAEFFAPVAGRASPFRGDETPIVFTGAMDYWPNIDAVEWFARDVLPALRQSRPALRFHIVGRSPSARVKALASDAVSVTGTVPDVRPYLQHAAVVVAPLRLARGIQNKVLEAMAMGRPVVASATCVQPIDARHGIDLLAAVESADFVREIEALLGDGQRAAAVGAAGRQRVLERYSWAAHLSGIEPHLQAEAAA
jgi:sugar transferase (PEP-CTERM/EpsH1 system associated)